MRVSGAVQERIDSSASVGVSIVKAGPYHPAPADLPEPLRASYFRQFCRRFACDNCGYADKRGRAVAAADPMATEAIAP